MRKRIAGPLAVWLLLTAACDDEAVDGGVGGGGAVTYPGPCRAVHEADTANGATRTWSYDEADRMVEIVGGNDWYDESSRFTFVLDGSTLAGAEGIIGHTGGTADTFSFTFGNQVESSWTSGAESHYETYGTYETSGFRFLGHPTNPVLEAPDAVLQRHIIGWNCFNECELTSDKVRHVHL